MLFARFLVENNLLIASEWGDVPVSLKDCEDLGKDEGLDKWAMATRFAHQMLPQVFRPAHPAFEVRFAREHRLKLEELIESLPTDMFVATDALGWVCQFWQSKKKDQVNRSEVKIGADELPAVTQLFTEPYMVAFLLDNTLGAWWAARRLSDDELSGATDEMELRRKAAIPGVSLEYLRFVRHGDPNDAAERQSAGADTGADGGVTVTESGVSSTLGSSDAIAVGPGQTNHLHEAKPGRWYPSGGSFDRWPERLSELRILDPCCGSGHFLVAAFSMLVPIRMELEDLSAHDAVDAVLFHHRPFVWHVWDGRRRDGFHALVSYHKLAAGDGRGRRLLESLTYSYLGDWIARRRDAVQRGEVGADGRLAAALELKSRLEAILEGEPPFDIFVRWKSIHEQPIGWEPDINDGVRLNIRPFMVEDIPGGKKGAGILRAKPKISWKKDRGKEVLKPIKRSKLPWLQDDEVTGVDEDHELRPREDYPWIWNCTRSCRPARLPHGVECRAVLDWWPVRRTIFRGPGFRRRPGRYPNP